MFHSWTPLLMIFRLVTIIITKCHPHRQAIFSLKVRMNIITTIVAIAVILATTNHPLQKTASSLVKSRLALGSQGLSVVCLSSCRICLEDKKIVFDFVQVIEAIKLFFFKQDQAMTDHRYQDEGTYTGKQPQTMCKIWKRNNWSSHILHLCYCRLGIPHIGQLWGTTTLFRPVQGVPKSA